MKAEVNSNFLLFYNYYNFRFQTLKRNQNVCSSWKLRTSKTTKILIWFISAINFNSGVIRDLNRNFFIFFLMAILSNGHSFPAMEHFWILQQFRPDGNLESKTDFKKNRSFTKIALKRRKILIFLTVERMVLWLEFFSVPRTRYTPHHGKFQPLCCSFFYSL